MENRSFVVQRPAFFTIDQLENIEEATFRILEKVGIAILDEEIQQQLLSSGFQMEKDRILINRKLVSEFIDAERKRNGDKFSESPHASEPTDSQIWGSVSPYPQWVHDIETDKVIPFTTEKLIEATKLLDVFASLTNASGLWLSLWGPPGCPADVPPALQPIVQYWVAANYSRHGRGSVDPKSLETLPYIMEMAEVLGNPFRSLPVYIFSPLALASESLKCVLNFKDKLSSVGITNMPSVGCTTPINVGDAYALSAAEVIGSAILLQELIDLPVSWGIGLFPRKDACKM